MESEECTEIIKENWQRGSVNPVDLVVDNNCKVLMELSKWGRSRFGDIRRRINQTKERIRDIQCKPDCLSSVETDLKCELNSLLKKEEIY